MPPPTRASLALAPTPPLSLTYGPYVDVIVAKMSRRNVSRSERQGSAPETSAKSHQLKNTKEATHTARFWQWTAGVQATRDRKDSLSHHYTSNWDSLTFYSSRVPLSEVTRSKYLSATRAANKRAGWCHMGRILVANSSNRSRSK